MKKQKKGVSPMTAAVVGMVVGAGAAVAGVIALNNEDNQKKLKGAVDTAKNKVTDFVESKKAMVKEEITEDKEKVADTLKTAKKSETKVKNIWQK